MRPISRCAVNAVAPSAPGQGAGKSSWGGKGGHVKILCTGDLHIGRRSTKVPAELTDIETSCAATWLALVNYALEEQVDLVAISGDLVDHDNRFFEALGPLEDGLRRLSEAGIPTYAVAGNHDYGVLPQLERSIEADQFHLIGRGGQWERKTFTRNGQPLLHIDGWSFPGPQVTESPLPTYPRRPDPEVPVLALLHADLDQAQSTYCPVSLAELQAEPVDLWLLGHIHKPAHYLGVAGPPVLYPGSPQAMDPGEPGPHGAWLVEFGPDRRPEFRQILLSTVRYETITVDLQGADAIDDAIDRITAAMLDELNEVAATGGDRVRRLVCRILLTGRTPLHTTLRSEADSVFRDIQELERRRGQVTAVIERIENATHPAVDLQALAKTQDPPGEIAKLILALDGDDAVPDEYRPLVAEATRSLSEVHRRPHFGAINEDPPPDAKVARQLLVEQGWRLLDALLTEGRR